jgi:RHS repeat-associated protein
MPRPTVVFVLFFVAAITTTSHAQAAGTGFPLFNSFAQHETDTVNEGNLNVILQIPIFSKAGRGLPLNYVLSYNTVNWYPALSPINNVYYWTWPGTGWSLVSPNISSSQPIAGHITFTRVFYSHACNGSGLWQRTNYVYDDPSGGSHSFSTLVATEADCNGVSHGSSTQSTSDGSGYTLTIDNNLAAIITTADGKLIHPDGSNPNVALAGLITDTNGNQVNNVGNPFNSSLQDTLGVTALQQNCAGLQCTLKYPSPTNPSNFVGATLNFTQMSVQSNFGCAGVIDSGNGTQYLLTSITLPDNSLYVFTYEPTPGYPAGNTTGRISSVTLPSGAQTTYQYTGPNQGIVCADGSVSGLTRTTPDGAWTYTRSVTVQPPYNFTITSSITTLIDPMGNKQVINFGKGDAYEKLRQIYSGTSTLLKTVETCYNGASFPCTGAPDPNLTQAPTQKTAREELPNASGKVSEVDTYYTNPATNAGAALPIDVWEYDFGSAAPGSLIRHTNTTYAGPFTTNIFYDPNNPSTSYSTSIVNRPASVTVYDGSGNTMAQTTYAYDETTPTPTTGTPSHVPVTGSHGNLTTTTQLVQGTTTIHSTKTYYDTGTVSTEVDANGNPPTTYAYGTGSCGNSFPTQVTDAAGFNTLFTWDCNGGVMTSTTDPNNQPTSYGWTDPNYWRLTQITYPDGGQKTATYNTATTPWSIVQTTKINGTLNLTTKTIYDSQVRVSQQQLQNDPDNSGNPDYTDTTYDADGRLKSVSNPYRTTSDPTYGITSHLYDGLGRVTSITEPDGSVVGMSYSANQTTVTDEAGKQRTTQVDGLGRLTSVWEAPNTSGYNFETDYQYDALGNLICAVQKGTDTTAFTNCASASATWRPRSFTYNALSRLITATNPESGTISYAYDNNGNVLTKTAPKPNQTGTATVVTTYTYDVLNRLTSKGYTGMSTAGAKYGYDGIALTGCTTTPPALTDSYPKQRGTSMCDASGGTSWAHDPMARTLTEKREIGTVTNTTGYAYNLDGSPYTLTYPTGRVLTYTPSSVGRPLSASDSTGPINYVSAAHYAAFGGLSSVTNGASIKVTDIYNDRLQPCWLYTTTGTALASSTLCTGTATTGTIQDVKYSFGLGANDNGNVLQIANNRNTNRTQNFLYDPLNRIAQAYTNGTNWGETFSATATAPGVLPATPGIDAWGNLTNRSGVTGKTSYEALSVSAATNNQLTGFTYDAAGNMTQNGSTTYTYDAENRLTSTSGCSFTYDGDGNRVQKTGCANIYYWRDLGGDALEESIAGTMAREYVFFGGKRVARRDVATNTVHYFFSDHLGSTSLVTNATGAMPPESESDYYPYGGEIVVSSPTVQDQNYKFTGKERDSESGLDNFGARYDASALGRFMTTDPVVITTERLMNPQQLNLYAYVANNPLRFIDPTGEILQCTGNKDDQKQCFADLQQIAGDAANRLSMDPKTGVVSFDTKGLDMSKNEGAALVNDLVGSKNTYDFSVGPTIMTDKGSVRIDKLSGDFANLPAFGNQTKGPNPPPGVSDILGLYLNNPNLTRTSRTKFGVAPEWTVAFHELAEAYEKIDGGKGGSYQDGHNAAYDRELTLRNQRPYLRQYNMGAGGRADDPNPQGGYSIIIKK